MKAIKGVFWLVGSFLWSQIYIIILMILLAISAVFILVSVRLAKISMEDYLLLVKMMALFFVPSIVGLMALTFSLKRLFGNATAIGKLVGILVLPISGILIQQVYLRYWSQCFEALKIFKVTFTGMFS